MGQPSVASCKLNRAKRRPKQRLDPKVRLWILRNEEVIDDRRLRRSALSAPPALDHFGVCYVRSLNLYWPNLLHLGPNLSRNHITRSRGRGHCHVLTRHSERNIRRQDIVVSCPHCIFTGGTKHLNGNGVDIEAVIVVGAKARPRQSLSSPTTRSTKPKGKPLVNVRSCPYEGLLLHISIERRPIVVPSVRMVLRCIHQTRVGICRVQTDSGLNNENGCRRGHHKAPSNTAGAGLHVQQSIQPKAQ